MFGRGYKNEALIPVLALYGVNQYIIFALLYFMLFRNKVFKNSFEKI